MHCFSCTWLCDPMDSSPPGFPLHGILQARILEWVTISFSIKLVYFTVISSKHSDQTTLAILAERINTELKKLESHTNIKINVTFLKKKHRWNFIKNISFINSLVLSATAAKSCLTLCDPIDYSLPSSSVHGIFKARILEWVGISFSRESSQTRGQSCVSCVSCIGSWVLYH